MLHLLHALRTYNWKPKRIRTESSSKLKAIQSGISNDKKDLQTALQFDDNQNKPTTLSWGELIHQSLRRGVFIECFDLHFTGQISS